MTNEFDAMLAELARARVTYEDLRTGGAGWDQVASARDRLHHLRSRIAELRAGLGS